MFELVIIVHFATGTSHEEIVERNIPSYTRCIVKGMQRLGRRLGAPDIAFHCEKQKEG